MAPTLLPLLAVGATLGFAVAVPSAHAGGREPGLVHLAQDVGRVGAGFGLHEVHPSVTAHAVRAGIVKLPANFVIMEVDPRSGLDGGAFVVRNVPAVRGEDLVDAQAGLDQRTNEPIVGFSFNARGARALAKFTTANIGHPFVVVLDGRVLSAPVIRGPILGGSGIISGSFTVETADALARQLRTTPPAAK